MSTSVNNLLDHVIEKLNLKNDAALCKQIGVAPPVMSKLRNDRLPLGATMLIKLHEATEAAGCVMSIKELKHMGGLPAYVRVM